MTRIHRYLLIGVLLCMSAVCSAHILQNFALIDVRRSMDVHGTAVIVTYDCKLKPLATNPPDKLIDLDGDGMARAAEKKAFFTQSRDYLVTDIYLMHNRDPAKFSLKEFENDPSAETFRVVLEAPLPAAPPEPKDELLILFDPVFLIALPTQQQEFTQTKVNAGPGVTLLTEDKQRHTEMSVQSGPNMNLVFQRDAKAIAAAPAPTPRPTAPVTAGAVSAEATSEAVAAVPEPATKDKAGEPTEAAGTKKLKEMISQKDIPPWLLMTYLFIAAWFGALHALTPGHGKTIVGAYLVGSRGRIRDAVYLGLIVTFTHTFSVIVLGIIALVAADRIAQTTLYNALGLASGFLVFLFGGYLFLLRLRAGGVHMHGLHVHGGHDHGHSHAHGDAHSHDHGSGHTHDHAHTEHMHAHAVAAGAEPHAHHEHEHVHTGVAGGDLVHSHGHVHLGDAHPEDAQVEHVHAHGPHEEAHSHESEHSHDHGHSHGGFAHTHTHDGHTHTHEIPDKLTIKGLFALGISGGIVPCPDAIIVLLIAIHLQKIGLGLAMIGAFSIGLAAVLVVIGIMMVSARPLLEKLTGGGQSKLTQFYLPVGSAFVVMILGLGILIKVLIDMRIVSINI